MEDEDNDGEDDGDDDESDQYSDILDEDSDDDEAEKEEEDLKPNQKKATDAGKKEMMEAARKELPFTFEGRFPRMMQIYGFAQLN